jgi:hypothetical protein
MKNEKSKMKRNINVWKILCCELKRDKINVKKIYGGNVIKRRKT